MKFLRTYIPATDGLLSSSSLGIRQPRLEKGRVSPRYAAGLAVVLFIANSVVPAQLTVSGANNLPYWEGFVLGGGQLIVSNILLNPGVTFTRTGGTLTQSGVLTLIAANIDAGQGSHQFGPVNLASGASGQTNSTLFFPTNACTLTSVRAAAKSGPPMPR